MKERESNIELLRLVCMFLIICVHFMGLSILRYSESFPTETGIYSLIPQLIRSLCVCAVDTFILISGYFSIRPKAKSFINFYLMCAFYAGVLYTINLYMTGSHINRWCVYNTLMPFGLSESSSGWWFLPNYLILYMLSPMLNKIADSVSKREFRYFLLIQGVVVFYFGWYRQMEWNNAGFNFINFIFLYFIGRYISKYIDMSTRFAKGGGLMLWLVFGIIMGLIDWAVVRFQWKSPNPFLWHASDYNSPLCIMAAVGLFVGFKAMKVKQSKIINWFAVSALSIYLVHNNEYYLSKQLYNEMAMVYDTYPTWKAYFMMFGIALTLLITIPLLDKIRIEIIKPIAMFITKIYDNFKLKSNLYI